MVGRKCPSCKKIVLNQRTSNSKNLYNGVVVFGSVHTECPKCKKKIVCGYLGDHKTKPIPDDHFVIITEEEYKEIMKEKNNIST